MAKLDELIAELERLVSTWLEYAAINRERDEFGRGAATARRCCASELNALLLLTASDWIPVNERLPEFRFGYVWVTTRNEQIPFDEKSSEPVVQTERSYWSNGHFYDERYRTDRLRGIIAWQPIEEPAPYREEGGE